MKKSVLLVLTVIVLLAALLRLWKLDSVAPSLFGDELDVGYHAYSILKTGKDYSGNSWPLHFQSLAEYRTPLYLYSAVPTVALFGISAYGVRLPAAIFGILTIPVFYLLLSELIKRKEKKSEVLMANLPLVGAALLAISPWHIQYSRAAFEVTELLFFLLTGIWLFLRAMRLKGTGLWLSAVSFGITAWVYSTAKFFTPLLLLALVLIFYKQIFALTKKQLFFALAAIALVTAPMVYDTVLGEGGARFGYISVFSDPTVEHEVGTARLLEANIRGESGSGLSPIVTDKVMHNKFTIWGTQILSNYLTSFSPQFLFLNGDPNPRHTVHGMGVLYSIEIIGLVAGFVFWATKVKDRKLQFALLAWILLGALPSALTRDGGNHATRLILTLPPLLTLVASGLIYLIHLTSKYRLVTTIALIGLYVISFLSYQHNYWYLNPWQSERMWHYGWSEAIKTIKEVESQYDMIIISNSDEPPWTFFAAHYAYDPALWHMGYPLKRKLVPSFGEMTYIDKFYFGRPDTKLGLYEWDRVLTPKMLFLANGKDVEGNLILEPERLPKTLVLVKAVAYPSGEPAFYLLSKKPIEP